MQNSPFMFNFNAPQPQQPGQSSPIEMLTQLLQMRKQQGGMEGAPDMQNTDPGIQPMQQAATPFGDALGKSLAQPSNGITWNGPRSDGTMPGLDIGKMLTDSTGMGKMIKLLGIL